MSEQWQEKHIYAYFRTFHDPFGWMYHMFLESTYVLLLEVKCYYKHHFDQVDSLLVNLP